MGVTGVPMTVVNEKRGKSSLTNSTSKSSTI